jgi:hypothetical protein
MSRDGQIDTGVMTERTVTDNKAVLYTFHKVREQCEQPNAEAWRAFLNFYSPLFLHLLGIYAPDVAAAPRVWGKTLGALAENNFERFRGTARQSEREFLADVRALLLETVMGEGLEVRPNEADAPEAERLLDPEKLGKLLEGLPLLHQEMLFFRLAGYTDASIEKMLRFAPRVAEKAFERLAADFPAAQNLEKDRCLWPTEWLGILREARGGKKENCPQLHQFLRVQDGQVSWYDKEPLEKHVSGCLYCLERWTALREVGHWRRVAPAVSSAQIEEFLLAVPVTPEPKKSLLRRMFR